MEKAFSTLYHDRLVPATDIFHISEKIYAKRVILQTYIYGSKADQKTVEQQLEKYDIQIKTLLEKYEKTYLVAHEKNHLDQLKSKIAAIKNLENRMLSQANLKENQFLGKEFIAHSEHLFLNVSATLTQLAEVQTTIGKELENQSKKIISGTNLYSNLQLILAIIIGVLIVSILFASNVVSIKSDKYRLN